MIDRSIRAGRKFEHIDPQNTITIAIADQSSRGPARSYDTINNHFDAINKFCRKMVSTASRLHFVYEAGLCG